MYRILALALALAAALPAYADDRADADRLARTLAPYLDEQTVLVAHLDVEKIDPNALFAALARATGIKEREIKDFDVYSGPVQVGRVELGPLLQQGRDLARQAGVRDAFIVFSLSDLPDPPFALLPLGDDANPEKLMARINRLGKGENVQASRLGNHLFIGSPKTRKRLAGLRPTPRPELARAFAAAGPSLAQVILLPTKDTRRVFEEVQPDLPRELGGGSIKAYTRGLSWAMLSLRTDPKLQPRLTLQSPDAASARELSKAVSRLIESVGKLKEVQEAAPAIDRALSQLVTTAEEDRVTVRLKGSLAEAVAPVVRAVRERERRDRPRNQLVQILLALHNSADVNGGRLPAAASYDKAGKPLLSWRVHILPYIEQQNLYQQFHLDEPWDSEHNKKLIAKMPAPYRFSPNAELAAAGKTTLLLPRGKGTLFAGKEGPRFPADVPDGTSNTIMLVAADDAHAVPWTKPDDLEIDLHNPLKGLAIDKEGRFWVGLADGSARPLPRTLDKATLRYLFDPADGQVIRLP
jgi:hypothetical protein